MRYLLFVFLCLTVSVKAGGVAVEPGCTVGTSDSPIGTVSLLADTPGLASSGSKSTAFAVLMDRSDDPVDARVVANLSVGWVDKNDFVVLVDSVLVDPVGVEDTEVAVLASDLLLGNTLQVALKLQVVDTLMFWLTVNHTTMILTLTSSATNSDTYDSVSLLSLVSKTVSFISTGRVVYTSDLWALTVFPSPDTKEKTHSITLLVTPKLFHIFVCTHLDRRLFREPV